MTPQTEGGAIEKGKEPGRSGGKAGSGAGRREGGAGRGAQGGAEAGPWGEGRTNDDNDMPFQIFPAKLQDASGLPSGLLRLASGGPFGS
jgi:hypothetical protein